MAIREAMMNRLKKSAALLSLPRMLLSILSVAISLAACTPEYTRRQGEELAGQARLLDSVDIERHNQRLLSRQTQVCLLSANAGEEAGADLLRTMQVGFTGYFLAVGVAGESIDYLRAVSSNPCPGAAYLFYVQGAEHSACDNSQSCQGATAQFVITVISADDHTLLDRIKFSIKNRVLPSSISERERYQKAFEQLAIALTGGK
jgi:hypothetical protein